MSTWLDYIELDLAIMAVVLKVLALMNPCGFNIAQCQLGLSNMDIFPPQSNTMSRNDERKF